MRILHVIGRMDFADGGPPVIISRLAAAQAQLGHEVGIAFYSTATDEQTDQQLARLPGWEKVAAHRFPRPGRVERIFGMGAARRLPALIAKADVVHLHSVWEMLLFRAAGAARAAGKPYLVVINGMLDPWSLAQKAAKKRLALALGYRRMLNGSAGLQVGSSEEADSLRLIGLTAPIVCIPNGVTLEEIDPLPPRGKFVATRPILKGRRFILFLGRLHHKKGLDYLADAFALLAERHPEVDLVVAGPDDGEHAPLQQRVVVAGLASRVHIVGPLYGAEKVAAMVDCDCFALPSRQEGFSVAVLEAMAACAPVVISDACHFPEVATTGAGEVVKLDAAAVAAALERILTSPQRRRFGWAGRSLVEARYTWQRVAEQTVAAYQNILGRGGEKA